MASALKTRMHADLNAARKDRDKLRTLVLSTLLADVHNREIEVGGELDDDGVVQVLSRAVKQRRDASSQMRGAGRPELADQEDAQAAVITEYLPEGLSESEVREIVREIIAGGDGQMGPVMGKVMAAVRGRFDGKEANRIVREELSARGA